VVGVEEGAAPAPKSSGNEAWIDKKAEHVPDGLRIEE
jgi:hypothetical protein